MQAASDEHFELPSIDGCEKHHQLAPIETRRTKELLMGSQKDPDVVYWCDAVRSNNCLMYPMLGRLDTRSAVEVLPKRDVQEDLKEFRDAKEKLLGPILRDKTAISSYMQEESAKVFSQPLIKRTMGRLPLMNRYMAAHASVTERDPGDLIVRKLIGMKPYSAVPTPRSTYDLDFNFDYPLQVIPDQPDCHHGFRKCISQVTDQDGWSRVGRNTWWDESGIYNTTHFRRQISTGPKVFRYMDRIKY